MTCEGCLLMMLEDSGVYRLPRYIFEGFGEQFWQLRQVSERSLKIAVSSGPEEAECPPIRPWLIRGALDCILTGNFVAF